MFRKTKALHLQSGVNFASFGDALERVVLRWQVLREQANIVTALRAIRGVNKCPAISGLSDTSGIDKTRFAAV